MNASNFENDPAAYAEKFSASITGSRYLAFRDVPELVKEYVTGTTALDYGCGPGESTQFLRSLNLDVEGMDVNDHMVNLAIQNDPFGKYEVIKSCEIPRDANTFDMVSVSGVLVHAEDRDELFRLIKEFARVLKVGGTLMAITNSEDMFNYEWLTADTRFEENRNLTSGSIAKYYCKDTKYLLYLHYWTVEDYHEAFKEAGLDVVRIHKPLGKDSDGYNWINEREKAYVTIYVGQKLPPK